MTQYYDVLGSFHEYLPTVKNLTSSGSQTFDIVIPSLPGYGFSSAAPLDWTPADTARIFNTLMVDVLGYDRYALFASDWVSSRHSLLSWLTSNAPHQKGSVVGYGMYHGFQENVATAHFSFLSFFPPTPDQIKAENITLTPFEQAGVEKTQQFLTTGFGYFNENANRVSRVVLFIGNFILKQLPL